MGSWLVGKVQSLCIERGGKIPLEDVRLLISPHCRRHEARVGSVPPSSLLPRRFSSALRILFFRPTTLDRDQTDHDLCRFVGVRSQGGVEE
jgi:hypothetical protein